MRFNRTRDFSGKNLTVNRERMSSRDASRVGSPQQQRIKTAHLLLQQPRSRVFLFALQGITANQFAECVRLMRGTANAGAHLVQFDTGSCLCRLKSGLASRQACPDNSDSRQNSSLSAS